MSAELHKLRIDKSHKVRHSKRSFWPWILLILLLLAAGVGAWQWQKSSSTILVSTLRIRPAEGPAANGDLVALSATGYIMAAHKVELASKVIGRVAWVGVEMGDKVKAGQVLVRLEDDDYRARVAQQQGQLDAAKAHLRELVAGNRTQEIASASAQYDRAKVESDNAERAYTRLKNAGYTASKAELEDAEALMNSKRAQADYARQQYELMKAGTREEQIAGQKATIEQLEGALALSNVDLTNTVIRAPQDSTVLERNVEVGEFVTNGFVGDRGAKGYVVSIADLNDLLVELDISQNDFAKVTQDQPCWVTTDAYPDRKYAGTVQLISPVANRQKATIEVRVKVTTPDGLLKPDMNATVSFLSPQKIAETQSASTTPTTAATIRIPASAVRNNTVFVVENDKALQCPITTGLTATTGDIEIKKGLIGGEDLILNPPESLKDGDPVKIK